MGNKDLQNIESKVRDSQMRYLDYHLSPDLFTRITQLLYLIEERKKGIAFYGFIGIHNPVIFPIPDLEILSREVFYLRNQLKGASKVGNTRKRKKKKIQPKKDNTVKPVKPSPVESPGVSDRKPLQQAAYGNQPGGSGGPNYWRPQVPASPNYSKEAERWNGTEIENWRGQLKGRIDSIAHDQMLGTDEGSQAAFEQMAWENDGVIKNLTNKVNKEPTTQNIIELYKQVAFGMQIGGEDSVASEAFEASANAQLKRLIAAYYVYKAIKKARYFNDLVNDYQAAQVVGCTNDPVMNRIGNEIMEIISSGIYK